LRSDSIVQKRLDRQEPIDLQQLADTVINSIREKLADEQSGDW
jgi:hypothetical protein